MILVILLVIKKPKNTLKFLKKKILTLTIIKKKLTHNNTNLTSMLTRLDSSEIICNICGFETIHKSSMSRHKKSCKQKENNDNKLLDKIENLEKEFKYKLEIIEKEKEIVEKEKEMAEREKELYQKLEKEKSEMLNTFMANANKVNQLIVNNKNLLDTIQYINYNNDSDFDNYLINTVNNDNIVTKETKTLILNNVTIVSRNTDNYINATQLCKAGNKKFSHWITLDSTKELISVLATDAGITASELVELNKGGNYKNQDSWVHPDLAIQLAQWLSPKFALQVSKWIRTLFSDGKAEVSLKLLKHKEKELRIKDKKIKLLENLHFKKQKRENYPESNVIYIVTTKDNKNNRIYIVGKAKNLTTRLSTYNKTAEHEVIYYKSCKTEEDMNIIETIVLTKLKDYKEKANRDRFILPENKDISFFTNIIDNSIKFFE